MTLAGIIGLALAAISGAITALMRQYKIGPWNPQNTVALDFTQSPQASIPPKNILPQPLLPTDRLYNVAKSLLGQKLTDNVDPSVGCAESVSNVLIRSGYNNPKIPTVNGLITWMLANGFTETILPLSGCVITTHRKDVNDPQFAHCGIIMRFGVASNDSRPQFLGTFRENYSSVQAWRASYAIHNSVTRYFIPK